MLKPHSKPSRDKKSFAQPKPLIQTTTLWDFPSQHYGVESQGDQDYEGVTPSYLIWNLLQRYTKPRDKVLDPMCGSGTTLDVCRDLDRLGLGFDLKPTRKEIQKADARKLPVPAGSVGFVFMDPPYSTHIEYSDDPRCIGKLDAASEAYYESMEAVIAEAYRVLQDGGYLALYVSDSFVKDKPFLPIGFELFARMATIFEPVDIVSVVRHNRKLKRNNWHMSAVEGNFYLRGFNYLFVMRKNVALVGNSHKHEAQGSLSRFLKNYRASPKGKSEVVTPDRLATAVLEAKKKVAIKPEGQPPSRTHKQPARSNGPGKKHPKQNGHRRKRR